MLRFRKLSLYFLYVVPVGFLFLLAPTAGTLTALNVDDNYDYTISELVSYIPNKKYVINSSRDIFYFDLPKDFLIYALLFSVALILCVGLELLDLNLSEYLSIRAPPRKFNLYNY